MNGRDIGTFLDNMSKGIMFIDNQRIIRLCNQTSKNFLGIVNEYKYSHDEGVLEKGDIIILADNDLGYDDGNLDNSDLKHIGINNDEIKSGNIILAVGSFDNNKIKAEYKFFDEKYVGDKIELSLNYQNHDIAILMDFDTNEYNIDVNKITIKVDDYEFSCFYHIGIGFMAALDGKTGNIKFFQSNGYTIRNESIGVLLRGGRFEAKTAGRHEYNIIGKAFNEIIDTENIIAAINNILEGITERISNEANEINHIPVIYSVFSGNCEIDGETVQGVYLILETINRLGELIKNHAAVIDNINKRKLGAIVTDNEGYILNATAYLGSGAKYREIMYLASRAAETKANVLITGESGTGKSLLATEIHNMKQDKSPFVEVNCGAIVPSLFESELFGYVEGAFTGALRGGKKGFFEQADGGTIFLDEISELPLAMQVKLLYVIQNKIIYRVGSTKKIPINVRIITACNRDLMELVEKQEFRRDLFYRLNIFPITLPPLRERKGEIRKLAEAFTVKFCDKYGLTKKNLSEEAFLKIEMYDWPGNVRELENTIERAVIICNSSQIYAEHIKLGTLSKEKLDLQSKLEQEERKYIEEALIETDGNIDQTLKKLNISKSALYRKISKYNLK